MRSSTFVIALASAAISAVPAAAGLPRAVYGIALMRRDYPTCSFNCLANADLGSCKGPEDLQCLCRDTDFLEKTSQCIADSCKGKDLDQANETAQEACRAAGFPISFTYTPTQSRTATASSHSSSSANSGGDSASTTTDGGSSGDNTPTSTSASMSATNTDNAAMARVSGSGLYVSVGVAALTAALGALLV